MNRSRSWFDAAARDTGYRADTIEKVTRIGELAGEVARHPLLGTALALKGGTALNLCFGPPRRLSVDLDFNFVGSEDRAGMLSGKLCALLDRGAPRDLHDASRLPAVAGAAWDSSRLRLLFVALAGTLNHPVHSYGPDLWRHVTDRTVREQLHPTLADRERPNAEELQEAAWAVVAPFLALTAVEREYTDRLQAGDLCPDLIFPDDQELAGRLARHPALLWKAQNARRHPGRS